MTTNEAITILEEISLIDDSLYQYNEKYLEALDIAIQTLKNEQTDGDLISRQTVLKVLGENRFRYNIAKEGYNGGQVLWSENLYTDNVRTKIEKLPSAEKTANKININEYVKVKLTDYGKEIFYHQYDEINSFYKCEKIKPHYPKIDKEGYTSFQLWHFMNLYGNYIDMGMQNVIEPLEIVFESAEKTAELQPIIRGKWLKSDIPDSVLSKCSVCGFDCGAYTFKYCPMCGAKMEE